MPYSYSTVGALLYASTRLTAAHHGKCTHGPVFGQHVYSILKRVSRYSPFACTSQASYAKLAMHVSVPLPPAKVSRLNHHGVGRPLRFLLITASGYPLALNTCLRFSISCHFVLPSHAFSALCLRHWMMHLLTLARWLESKLRYQSMCVLRQTEVWTFVPLFSSCTSTKAILPSFSSLL